MLITEQRVRRCVNCAFGETIVAGKMYCSHPIHHGRMNEINHTCVNWKDRRHGKRDDNGESH